VITYTTLTQNRSNASPRNITTKPTEENGNTPNPTTIPLRIDEKQWFQSVLSIQPPATIYQVKKEMKRVTAKPEEAILIEFSDSVIGGQDPYRVGTKSLFDIQRFKTFKTGFKKLDPRKQLDLLSKIVENGL